MAANMSKQYIFGWRGKLADPRSPSGGGGPGFHLLPLPWGNKFDLAPIAQKLNPYSPINRFSSVRDKYVEQANRVASTVRRLLNAFFRRAIRTSQWVVSDTQALTVSAGLPIIDLDVNGGQFQIDLENTRTGKKIVLNGTGVGIGIGVGGLIPASVSGTPPDDLPIHLQGLPERISSIFLGILQEDDPHGEKLFGGFAHVYSGGVASAVIEAGVSIVMFADEILDFAGPVGMLDVLKIKAIFFTAGLDYTSDVASVGADFMIYGVTVKVERKKARNGSGGGAW